MTSNPNDIKAKIAAKVKPWTGKIEIIAALLILIGVSLKYSGIEGMESLIIIAFTTLSIIYFISAFYIYEELLTSPFAMFAIKLNGLSLSVLSLGILFAIQHFHGNDMMLIVGTLNVFISLLLLLFTMNSNTKSDTLRIPTTIRTLIIGLLGVIFLLNEYDFIDLML